MSASGIDMSFASEAPFGNEVELGPERSGLGPERSPSRGDAPDEETDAAQLAEIRRLLGEISGTWTELVRSLEGLRAVLQVEGPLTEPSNGERLRSGPDTK